MLKRAGCPFWLQGGLLEEACFTPVHWSSNAELSLSLRNRLTVQSCEG